MSKRPTERKAEVRTRDGFYQKHTVFLEGHQVGEWYASQSRAETIAGFLRLYADDVVFATLSDDEVDLILKHRGIDCGPAFERVKAARDKTKASP